MAKATNADVKNNELIAEELAQQYTGALVKLITLSQRWLLQVQKLRLN